MGSLQDVEETGDFWETEISNFADFVWAGSSLLLKLSVYALGGAALYLPIFIVLAYMIENPSRGKRSLDMFLPRKISSRANDSLLLPRMVMEALERHGGADLTKRVGMDRSEEWNKSLYSALSHSPIVSKSGFYFVNPRYIGLMIPEFILLLPFVLTLGASAFFFSVYLASLLLYAAVQYGIHPLFSTSRRTTVIGANSTPKSAIWRQGNVTEEADAQVAALTARILRAVEDHQWRSNNEASGTL